MQEQGVASLQDYLHPLKTAERSGELPSGSLRPKAGFPYDLGFPNQRKAASAAFS